MGVTGVGEPPPEGAKKGLTPFVIFSRRFHDMVRKEHPDFTFSEVGCELGARWKAVFYQDSFLSSVVSEKPQVSSPIYFRGKALEAPHDTQHIHVDSRYL